MVATLQREEDQNKNDFDYGGTSRYLGKDEQPNVIASLIDNGTGRIKFLDAAYHRLRLMVKMDARSMMMRSTTLGGGSPFG